MRREGSDMEMLQSLLPSDAGDVEMLGILGAAFLPGIIGLLLAVFALWLPDDGYVLSQQVGDRRRQPPRANNDKRDWRRAA